METSKWVFWPVVQQLVGPEEKVVHLTRHQSRLLEGIIRSHGPVARLDYLIQFVWEPDDEPASDPENTLKVFICKLRKILAEGGADFEILTNHSVGFHLTKKVPMHIERLDHDRCRTCGQPLPKLEDVA